MIYDTPIFQSSLSYEIRCYSCQSRIVGFQPLAGGFLPPAICRKRNLIYLQLPNKRIVNYSPNLSKTSNNSPLRWCSF